MIDIEADVFSFVAERLRAEYPGIFVAGEYVDVPAKFPAVTIVENDNRIDTRYRTNNIERAVTLMYECNIYSNKANGKKAEAKAVTDTMDGAFEDLGFTRTMKNQVANLNDASIYRIVCRYEAVVIPNDDGKYYIHTN